MGLNAFTKEEIVQNFRLTKSAILELYSKLKPMLESTTHRSQPLPGMTKLLGVLHYFASGSFQYCVASKLGLSQATFSRVLRQVIEGILSIQHQYIKFPESDLEISYNKEKIFEIAGFPNIVGLIDCTHVALSPKSDIELVYRNRKCYHSINVQITCGPNFNITDVVARFPGSTHDAFILASSSLGESFSNGQYGEALLLGDNGYRLTPWLQTPYIYPSNAAERKFNWAHRKTRSLIERLFGILKSRFRCLDFTGGTMLYSPELVCKIVVSCCVLHNIGSSHHVPINIAMDLREHIPWQREFRHDSNADGSRRRREITDSFFTAQVA